MPPSDSPRADSGGTRSGVFFPGVEGLRAVAALLVLVVHTSFVSGFTPRSEGGRFTARGEVGVVLFFLISGFLLYRPFATAALGDRPAPRLGPYLVRRFLRIVPLYWTALTVVYLIEGRAYTHGVSGLLRTYLFVQVYSNHWVRTGITQAWSLDVEVLFYLLLPVWAALMRRRSRPARRQVAFELGGLVLIYLLSTGFRWFALTHPSGAIDTWHAWLPSWADMFAMGMALAVISSYQQHVGQQFRLAARPGFDVVCWLAAAGVYVVFSTGVGLQKDPYYVGPVRTELAGHALYGLFALLLLLPAVFGPADRGPMRRALTWRPVAFLGLISYGIYLWHQLVVQELVDHTGWNLFNVSFPPFLLAAFVITVALAAVSYFAVERPATGARNRWQQRRERLALHLRDAPEPSLAPEPTTDVVARP